MGRYTQEIRRIETRTIEWNGEPIQKSNLVEYNLYDRFLYVQSCIYSREIQLRKSLF